LLALGSGADGMWVRPARDVVLVGVGVRAATVGDWPTAIQGDGSGRERGFGLSFAAANAAFSLSSHGEVVLGLEADGVARCRASSDWRLVGFAAGSAAVMRPFFGSLPP
jgi:hypothetical protein